ncbi:MAG: hypothetical protein QG641_1215, partial [Candidatus Poribacteria bacterium]|nr:hypothetical protein [Candidatus Poribacteria bacterium]
SSQTLESCRAHVKFVGKMIEFLNPVGMKYL